MKILLTTPSLTKQGGVASYINSVLPFLAKRHEVHCLAIGNSQKQRGIHHAVRDQLGFRQLIHATPFHLCHVNPSLNLKSFFRDGLLIWQAKRAGVPVVVFIHGWRKDFANKVSAQFLWFFHKTFGQADAFIVLASEFEQALRQWGVRQPVFLGTTTVAEELLAGFSMDAKGEQLRQAETIKILFLARLEREKGVFETVDAICELVARGLPVVLTIAGDGSAMDALRRYINEKNLPADTIRLLGYVQGPEKKAVFVENHIYCFPTYYGEGLPTSVLEAMAFGMPVVTCPVGGIVDFFEEGKMGRLCHHKTPMELVTVLQGLLADRQQCLAIGQYNHAYAKEHFMAAKVAEKLIGIYQTLL